MPTIDEAVDFLRKNDSLHAPEDSPGRKLEEDEEANRMDWDHLWSDKWEFSFSQQDESDLVKAFEVGPPPNYPDTPCNSNDGAHWDKCAWYQPIHFFGHKWGIFIKESCVRRTALMIARFVPPADRQGIPHATIFKNLYRAAVLVYFLHEHYHHKIECLGFRLHVILSRSCYLPYKLQVYRATFGTDDNLEEALANADSYLRLYQNTYQDLGAIRRSARAYLRWEFSNCSPPGYRMAVNYLQRGDFKDCEHYLLAQFKQANVYVNPIQPVHDWNLCPDITTPFFNVSSNIWTVIPRGGAPRLPTIP